MWCSAFLGFGFGFDILDSRFSTRKPAMRLVGYKKQRIRNEYVFRVRVLLASPYHGKDNL